MRAHLALQVADTPLSKAMHNFAFRYTQWVNRRKNRSGHLFQGRYQALLVDRDSYLLELVRYIHLNPVRAGLTRTPAAYRWSGQRAYLGREQLPWLTTEWVLGQFGKRLGPARKHYATFVAAGTRQGHRQEFHRGAKGETRVLGDDRFLERVLNPPPRVARPPALGAILRHVCAAYGIEAQALASPARARRLAEARGVAGWLALQTRAATLSELGAQVQRDATTLSRMVGKIDQRVRSSKAFARKMRKSINAIMQA
ncbi:MAG: transposase [Gammaproteobacteria bacterium]|nr:MAG: transposase [Gammaproteobacteria bacterium]